MTAALSQLKKLAEEIAQSHGLMLYGLRMVTRRQGQVLEVLLDKPREAGQVTIAECVAVSREMSLTLDEDEEMVSQAYSLEVSSPGVERDLETHRHYEMALGEYVHIWMHPGFEGPLEVKGCLAAFEEGEVTVRIPSSKKYKKGQKPRHIPMEQWDKATLAFEDIQKARTVYDKRSARKPAEV